MTKSAAAEFAYEQFDFVQFNARNGKVCSRGSVDFGVRCACMSPAEKTPRRNIDLTVGKYGLD